MKNSCTPLSIFDASIEEEIKKYSTAIEEGSLEDIDSVPAEESLAMLIAYRDSRNSMDEDSFIRELGAKAEERVQESVLLKEAFLETLGQGFAYQEGDNPTTRIGVLSEVVLTDGGIRVSYTRNKILHHHVFSLTGGGRSTTNNKNKFIKIPEFQSFLDLYTIANFRAERELKKGLGSNPGVDFKLRDEYRVEDYVHGNVEHMRNMIVKLHELGGEKASAAELDSYLSVIDKMSPEMFENLKLFIEEEADKSGGMARASRIDIKVKGDPASIGNQQSEASIYLEEVLHSMTVGALDSKTVAADKLRRQLDYLIELGRSQLTWESFLPDEKDSINSKVEEAYAKELYSYIFESDNANYEFLAKGIAQPEVSNALAKVKIRDKRKDVSLLEKIQELFSTVVNVLTGNLSLKNKNNNVKDALINLAYDLGEINTKKSQKLLDSPGLFGKIFDIVFNDTDRAIQRNLHNITKGTFDKLAAKKVEETPEGIFNRTKAVTKMVGLSLVNPVYTKTMGAIATSYGLKPDGTVREIISGLFETEPVQRVGEFLVLQAGYIDKVRNKQIGVTRDSILSSFKDVPTKAEEEALTAILVDTGLSSIVGNNSVSYISNITSKRVFDNSTIRQLLTDDKALDKRIQEAKRTLKHLDSIHYHWHANQAVGLGIYMAKHTSGPAQNFNAENIVKGIHSSHRKAPKKAVVAAVDELSTLVAIKNSASKDRLVVAEFMKKDYKGFQALADIVEGFIKNSDASVFKGKKTNKIKGYSKELFDDSLVMETALLSERASMEAQGYTFKGVLPSRIGQGKKMALYVTDSSSRPERLRGGVRLNQIRSKGSTVTESNFKQAEGSSYALVRERAKRDINEIQKIANTEAKNMESGEYDFKDTMFGVAPLINEDGTVLDYRYMMDKKTKKSLLKQDTKVSEVMSRSFGSLIDKEMGSEHNSKVLFAIKKDMEDNWKEGSKGKDGLTDFTLIGPNVSNPEMQKLFYMLPKEFQSYVNKRGDKTLAVRTSMKNMYFGYSQLSITDFPYLKKITPEVIIKAIKVLENIWMEVVQIAKTNILMKMPVVTISNFLSNIIYLTMKGYNPIEVIALQIDSFKEIKTYNRNAKRQQELKNRQQQLLASINRDNLGKNNLDNYKLELRKTQGELKALNKRITESRVHELIEMGLDQSVEDISTNVIRDTNKISQFFDEKLDKLPSAARTGVDYLFLTKRTKPYQVVNEFLEITDLMSRDIQNTMEKRTEQRQARGDEALPTWWVDQQPEGYNIKPKGGLKGDERAKFLAQAEDIRKYELVEDYVNYALPSSSVEEYLNKVGVLMFTKYVKRIQRIIAKTGSKGPIKSIAALMGAGYIGGLPTIHEQSFLVKDWYTDSIGPGNVFPIYSPIDVFMNVITPSLLKESTYQFGW